MAAAIAQLDDEGLDALTMRRLGARGRRRDVAVPAPAGRTAVLAAVVARMAGEAVWYRSTTRRRGRKRCTGSVPGTGRYCSPLAVPLLATQAVDADTATAIGAGLFDSAPTAGVDEDAAQTAVQSVPVFVLCYASAQVGTHPASTRSPHPPTDYYHRPGRRRIRCRRGSRCGYRATDLPPPPSSACWHR